MEMRARWRMAAGVAAAAVLAAGCGADASHGSGGSARATLTVHIGLFGGPMNPDGGMALSDRPAAHQNVTAVSAAGHRSVALTDGNGVVTMSLPPGRYTVFSTYCGTGPHHVVLTADRTRRVRIVCAVP